MPPYLISSEALRELDEIIATIKADNKSAAEKWSLDVREKLATLARHPRIGRIRPDLLPDTHMFPFGDYLIFYDIDQDGITVLHVAHARRDIPNLFTK